MAADPIDIQIRAKALLGEAQKQIAQFLKDVENNSEEAGKKSTLSFSQIAKVTTLTAGAVTGLAAGIGVLGSRGADVADLRENFQLLNRTIGNDSIAVLADLRAAFLGTISDADLMKMANQALAAGLKPNREEFKQVADAAKVLADRLNIDASQAFDTLATAMATGKTKGAELLIGVVDNQRAIKDYADSIHVAVEDLSEQEKTQAQAIAVMDRLKQVTDQSGKASEDFGDKVQQQKAKIKNFVDGIAEWIATSPGIGNWTSTITALSGTLTAVSVSVGPFTKAIGAIGPLLGSAGLMGSFASLTTFIGSTVVPLFTVSLPAAFAAVTPFLLPAGAIVVGVLAIYEAWKHWDSIVAFFKGGWQFVVNQLAKIPDYLLPVLGPIGMVVFAFRHWDEIPTIAKNVYNGVKTWLVDKFMDVVGGVKGKVDAVVGFFRDMYDTLVGHSIVPDLQARMKQHFDQMGDHMDKSTKEAADKVKQHFEEIAQLRDKLFGLDNIKSIKDTIEAIGGLAGVAKLDADEMKNLHDLTEKAIEAAERNGKVVPELWRQIQRATYDAGAALDDYITKERKLVDQTTDFLGGQLGNLKLEYTPVLLPTLDTHGFAEGLKKAVPGIQTATKPISEQMGHHMGDSIMGGLNAGLASMGGSILAALQGGGNVLKSVGSSFGKAFTEHTFGSKGFTDMITKNFGGALGGMINNILPGIGAIAGPLLAKLGGLFKHLFGGPSGKELEGRSAAAEFRDSITSDLTGADKVEVATNVLAGWNKQQAEFAVGLKNKFIAAGHSGDEALALVNKLFEAEKQGGPAVERVIAEITVALGDQSQAHDQTAQRAVDSNARITESYAGQQAAIDSAISTATDASQRTVDALASQQAAVTSTADKWKALQDSVAKVQGVIAATVSQPVGVTLHTAVEAMSAGQLEQLHHDFDAVRDEFKGTFDEFVAEQAKYYNTLPEGDPRLKTVFYGDDLKKFNDMMAGVQMSTADTSAAITRALSTAQALAADPAAWDALSNHGQYSAEQIRIAIEKDPVQMLAAMNKLLEDSSSFDAMAANGKGASSAVRDALTDQQRTIDGTTGKWHTLANDIVAGFRNGKISLQDFSTTLARWVPPELQIRYKYIAENAPDLLPNLTGINPADPNAGDRSARQTESGAIAAIGAYRKVHPDSGSEIDSFLQNNPEDYERLAHMLGIPGFARGGMLNRPTFGLLGEGGEPEIAGPVSFMTKALTGALSQVKFGGGGHTFNFNVYAFTSVDFKRTIEREVYPTILRIVAGNIGGARTDMQDALGIA